MSPREIAAELVREVPALHADDDVGESVKQILACEVPALPVVGGDEKFVGIFGEREFIGAIFPGYLGELKYAGFVSEKLSDTLEKRASCRTEPVSRYMNTEHIDVGPDWSDAQLAEIFLHHRVLIIPITEEGRVLGIITRWSFFKALAEQWSRQAT